MPARRTATAYCYWDLVPAPWRSITVAVDSDGRLVEIRLDGRRPEGRRDAKRCRAAAAQLGEYFGGKRREFDLDLAPYGTDFQLRVWQALREIPYGAVRNYGDIARAIGQPGAARAVGQANGCNPAADRHPVPPRHRERRLDRRLLGRAQHQAPAARARRRRARSLAWRTTCAATGAANRSRRLSLPLARLDECPKCHVHLHVCRMCERYAPRKPKGCSEDDAPEVRDKKAANFCDYFKPTARAYRASGAAGRTSGTLAARRAVQEVTYVEPPSRFECRA